MAVHGLLSVVLAFVLTGLSTVVVALRFYTRHVLVGKLGPSDWVMLLALIAAWASVAVNWYLIHFLDFGRATSRESITEMVTMSLLFIWIYRLSYLFNLCLIKTSILLFYKRIASMRKSFHHLVGGLIAIILIGSASMIVAAVLTCYPVDDAWKFDVFERGTKGIRAAQCYNPGPFWIANASYNLATDILIWLLPILFFLNLTSMSWRRRLEFIAIFSVGIMAIVASAARLRTIVIWLSGPKQQQENAGNLMIWSQVEQNTGIIAGSIPLLRPLFRRMLGRVRGLEHPHRGPAVLLIEDDTPEQAVMPRALIIPSPTPTIDEREFSMPKKALAPIELRPQCAWGNTIWDGTQVRQVLT